MLDLPPLALSLCAVPAPRGVRALIDAVPALGVPAIVLDAAHPETRPRALDASARRDLASLLRRCGLAFAGLDLWIPPEHFADPIRADRAVDAAVSAISLLADIARHANAPRPPSLSLALPPQPVDGALAAIASATERTGVTVADHAWPCASPDASPLASVGVDPATLIMAGADPSREVSGLLASRRLSAARLSDAGSFGRLSVGAPGARLDALAYSIALTTGAFRGWVVIDVRGLSDPLAAIAAARDAWRSPTLPS